MERVIVGRFMCAMNDCKKNSGADRNLSFFRFPSNPERYKLLDNLYTFNINLICIHLLISKLCIS